MTTLYITATGVWHQIHHPGVSSTAKLALADVPAIIDAVPHIRISVRQLPPWDSPLACHECGHRTTESRCKRSEEGLDCPYCHERGSMCALYRHVYYLDQLDVFERDGGWYWAVEGQYPTGPFEDKEHAREDAMLSVSWVLDEPNGKPLDRRGDQAVSR